MNTEQRQVSELVHSIIDHYQERFISHIANEDTDTAIAIGDEILEWIKDVDAEEIFYYIESDLQQLYNDAKRSRRKKRKR